MLSNLTPEQAKSIKKAQDESKTMYNNIREISKSFDQNKVSDNRLHNALNNAEVTMRRLMFELNNTPLPLGVHFQE